jgi:hypothetical protein
MNIYIFHRADLFYPIELKNDDDARRNAECNPGTTKVENAITNEVVWLPTSDLNVKGSVATGDDQRKEP